MLKITRILGPQPQPTFRLEGRVVGAWVEELERAWDQAAESVPCLGLDLAAVTFVDAAGIELLRRLVSQGAQVVACSGFVGELLSGEK
jgi:hypothetical protein